MTRREAREKAVQALYQIDMRKIDPNEALAAVNQEEMQGDEHEFLKQLVHGAVENQAQIDEAIKKNLRNWTMERLAFVDRAILRIAVYEILYDTSIPSKVSMNEALELAKSFGMEESVKFINAVLANIVKETDQSGEAVQ
ncbi:transcription antitermination factor NusB [Ammoniphilus resinae]|uniref:Transcription antitermination protein NusB n=1 Tax=Ammoniphilus resinae TaxID=861532 RepID=A0ABS4GV89_9BACL|nr:transcription antitermination factor NusB [Ammoniphilus resinae]MBP1934186.1 N utilization substance protein B [Ammoniphilus resinae]